MALTTDFALEGFRIIRERPQLVLYWIAVSLVKYAAGMLILTALAGPELMEWQKLMPDAVEKSTDPAFMARFEAIFQVIGPTGLLVFAAWQMVDGVLYAAIVRAVTRSAPYKFGYLTFGVEAWRMVLVNLSVYALMLVILIGLMFMVVIITALTGFEQGFQVIATFVSTLGVIFALMWAYVRLSFSWAASADTGKLAIVDGLKLTKGIAWPLFGGYALSGLLTVVVSYLVQLIFGLITLAIKGQELSALASAFAPDFSSVEALLKPESVIYIFVSACTWPLTASLMLAASTAAYQQIKAKRP